MRVKFYLKRPKSKTETSIYALVNYNRNSLKIYTGEAILPKHWNPKANAAKNTPSFTEHPEFNERIHKIRSTISRVFNDFKNRNDHSTPAPAVLKPLIETALKKGFVQTSLFSFFEEFANSTMSGTRVNPRTKKAIKGTGGRGYITTLNHLKAFDKTWNRKVSFDTIDLDFYGDFTNYLKSLLLSLNSVGSHIQRIKTIMSEALDKKLTHNTDFRSKRFVKLSEDSDSIYLNEAELREMRNLKLSDNPRLDNIRDLFLIGCYTGLRFSDFSILKPQNIKDGFIKIKQVKTGSPIVIPVHSVVKKIISKHNGSLPKSISNVKTNEYLKEIGQMLPMLKEKVTKEITKGGIQIMQLVEKWELLTSHTARRSFATNEYNAGTPTLIIMAITGHKSEKSFLKYIRVTPDEHARKLKTLWERRSKMKVA